MRPLPILFALALFTALAGTVAAPAAAAEDLGRDGELCRYQTDRQGRLGGLPQHLLTALSHVESGRWDEIRREKTAWPWTVMAEGRGRYFRTKAEAIAEVRGLRARGVRNIDVGCMQINLFYHADAFPTLEAAFDPATNVAYAVDFLQRLRAETGSWDAAALRYHSATPQHAQRYAGVLRRELKDLQTAQAGGPSELVRSLTRPGAFGPGHATGAASASGTQSASLEAYRVRQQQLASQRQAAAQAQRLERHRQEHKAKSFAEDWRTQRLKEWKERREAAVADAS